MATDDARGSDVRRSGLPLDYWASKLAGHAYNLVVYLTIVFLLAPLAMVVLISFQQNAYAAWPPQGLTLQWYTGIPEQFGYLGIESALATSVTLAVATAVVSTVIGGLAAFAIIRYDFKYSTTLETILLSPLIYPWIVVGLALLLLVGKINAVTGLDIKLSFWTLLVGHVMFTLPYPVRTVGASLQNYNLSLEEAARNLGATEAEAYLRVTLPLIRPGVLSGLVFTFVLSFNQYIISLFLSGPQTKTMPLLLFSLFYNTSPAQLAAIATLMMTGILSIVLVTEYVAGISEFM